MAKPSKYLVAPDSFKGTLSAGEVAEAIGDGVKRAGATADLCPAADGGEGTAAVLLDALEGERRSARVHDPLGREIEAEFGLIRDGKEAVVDVAAASGLTLVDPRHSDPKAASTAGTGELIVAAAEAGARKILVAAGGSATTDGGDGAIKAIEAAGGLGKARLEVLCDTTVPFEDAANVFAPQKGATPEEVERLTARLVAFAGALPRDPRGRVLSGAAGGLSGGLWAAFGAHLIPGAATVLGLLGFDRRLEEADAVISGEGRFDRQSWNGKLVGEVARRCRAARVPLHLIAGEVIEFFTETDQDARRFPMGFHEMGITSYTEAGTHEGIGAAAERIAASAGG
jgi:glycerate kinase